MNIIQAINKAREEERSITRESFGKSSGWYIPVNYNAAIRCDILLHQKDEDNVFKCPLSYNDILAEDWLVVE